MHEAGLSDSHLNAFNMDAQTLLDSNSSPADSGAIQRVHTHLPQVKYGSVADARAFPLTVREAETVIARENGCQSFGELRLNLKLRRHDYREALDKFKALVRSGAADELDALLSAHPELKSTLDDPHFDFGSTALIIAKSNLPLVDALLNHGADINATSQWWAGDFHILELADADLAAALVERGAHITVHAAAEQGWLDWLESAYESDPVIVNQPGGDGKTPLHYADEPAVIDWLLARGADLEARDLDHRSAPLQWKIAEGKLDTARELARRGARVDIFAAVVLGDASLVEAELEREPNAIRARVNSAGYDLTPQADGSHQYVYAFNGAGLSPHQVALETGQSEMFDLLLSRSPVESQLLARCAAGDEAEARRIAEAHPGLVASLPEADRRQLLHAAWTAQTAIVKLMLSLGFDIHIADDDKMTPLHWAAFHGHVEVAAALLEADDSPPLTWLNAYGGTPLATCLYGSRFGWRDDGDHLRAMQLLVDAGSEVRAEWLPTGDDDMDAILRRALPD